MIKSRYKLIALILLFSLFSSLLPAYAAEPYWITYSISGTCNTTSFHYNYTTSYSLPTGVYAATVRTFNGANPFSFNQTFAAGSGGPITGGPVNVTLGAALTLPYTITDTVTLHANNAAGLIVATGTINMICNASGIFSGSGAIGNVPLPSVAVSIPWWYELEKISCDTPVYDGPGGNVLTNTLVKAGQTWYIDNNPVTDSKGQPWLAIYMVTTATAYIPAACAGGQWFSAEKHLIIQYDYSLISAACDANGFNIQPYLKLNTSIDLVFKASNYINGQYQYTYQFNLPRETYYGPGLALPLKFDKPLALPYTFSTIWRMTSGLNTYGIVAISLNCTAKGAAVTFKTTYYIPQH